MDGCMDGWLYGWMEVYDVIDVSLANAEDLLELCVQMHTAHIYELKVTDRYEVDTY